MSDIKKRNVSKDGDVKLNTDSESESDNEDLHPEAYTGNEEIQVDFEGRNPIDTDFHGIRQLLQQLFIKAHVNISELADIIIAQSYIGSVVIQSEVDGEEEDDDEDMCDPNIVFGITTAVNMTNKKDIECIQQIRSYIIEKAGKEATDSTLTLFRDILGNDARPVGLLLNERFVNIPAQISVPLFDNLYKEIKRANDKKMPYNFAYYIMFVKFYRQEAKKNKPAEDIYSNPEEELMCKEAVTSFEYSVQAEADSGMSGDWLEGDSSLTPYRKLIVFDASRFPDLVFGIKEFIEK